MQRRRLGRWVCSLSAAAVLGSIAAANEPHTETKIGPGSPKTLLCWKGHCEDEADAEEDSRLATDRPHVAEGSRLVGLGNVQLETGYSFFRDDDAGTVTTTHSFPEPLLRWGVMADWFELRFGTTWLVETIDDPVTGRSDESGIDDLYLGAKLALTEQAGALPEMALFPQMRVPTGSSAFTSDEVLPGFNFAYSWKVNDLIELECNTQINRRKDDDLDHFFAELTQVFNVEYDLSKRWGAFSEWFVFGHCGALAARTEHYLHGGFVYFLTPNLQLDFSVGVGLNDAASDWAFTGVGLSKRW